MKNRFPWAFLFIYRKLDFLFCFPLLEEPNRFPPPLLDVRKNCISFVSGVVPSLFSFLWTTLPKSNTDFLNSPLVSPVSTALNLLPFSSRNPDAASVFFSFLLSIFAAFLFVDAFPIKTSCPFILANTPKSPVAFFASCFNAFFAGVSPNNGIGVGGLGVGGDGSPGLCVVISSKPCLCLDTCGCVKSCQNSSATVGVMSCLVS